MAVHGSTLRGTDSDKVLAHFKALSTIRGIMEGHEDTLVVSDPMLKTLRVGCTGQELALVQTLSKLTQFSPYSPVASGISRGIYLVIGMRDQ